MRILSRAGTLAAAHAGDSIDASDVPCEPYQAWKLLMLADMVQNGFPLVDALNLKSYLGNLIVSPQGLWG
jgi:hypothetical protein